MPPPRHVRGAGAAVQGGWMPVGIAPYQRQRYQGRVKIAPGEGGGWKRGSQIWPLGFGCVSQLFEQKVMDRISQPGTMPKNSVWVLGWVGYCTLHACNDSEVPHSPPEPLAQPVLSVLWSPLMPR